MNRIDIKEVEKIIESHRSTYEYGNPPVTHGSFTDEDVELSAKQIAGYYSQLFPQPLDGKELREKLNDYFAIDSYGVEYQDLQKELRPYVMQKTGGMLALLQPKIEEAIKQERERILKLFDDMMERKAFVDLHIVIDHFRQALSGKGGD